MSHARRTTFALGFAPLLLLVAPPIAAQNGPLTAARAGSGQLHAGPHEESLVEAFVDLAPGGEAEIELRSRDGDVYRVAGTWTAGRGEQRMLAITAAAGDPNAHGNGWVMTQRGRLTRIEIGGRAYGGRRLDISFDATGTDLEPPERWRYYQGAGNGWGELVQGGRRSDVERVTVELQSRGPARIVLEGRGRTVVEGRWTSRDLGVIAIEIASLDGRPASGAARVERRDAAIERLLIEGRSAAAPITLDFRAGARPPRPDRPGPGRGAFTEEYGYDQPGGDIRRDRAEDLAACQRLCADEWRCRAYTFNTRDRMCYLKDSERPLARRSDCVTGVKREFERGISERPGYNLEGGDYTSVFLPALEDCQRACRNDNVCLAYTYNTRSRMCYLKDRVGTYSPRADTVSGEKAIRR